MMLQSPWLGNVHRDFVLPDLPAIVEKSSRSKRKAARR
jgi:hypothetical protein